MNHIDFRILDPPVAGWRKPLGIFVDGRSLLDIVAEAEASFADPAGGGDAYYWLPAQYVLPPSRHLWGEPFQACGWPVEGVALLGCPCGVPDCWSFTTRVAMAGGRVGWLGFRQYRREHWRYDALGGFVFAADQYEAALSRAAAAYFAEPGVRGGGEWLVSGAS